MEEQFPAFTVDERACSDPCQIEAHGITVQHESKQQEQQQSQQQQQQQLMSRIPQFLVKKRSSEDHQ